MTVTLAELLDLRHTAKRILPPPGARNRAQQAGEYRSLFKGRGMEFAETRDYQPGDDIRHMEWRVTARTGRPHVKLFREERERAVLTWIDCRPAMFHATRGRLKIALAARAATLAAWSATQGGDRLGCLLFSDRQHSELRPARGDRAVLSMIRELLRFATRDAEPPLATSSQALGPALLRLRQVAPTGGALLLFSDFRGLDATAATHLTALARHNDLTLFFLHDPLERSLPPAGGRYPVLLPDQTQPVLLNVNDPNVRAAYAARFAQRHDTLQRLCQTIGARFLSCSTEEEATALLHPAPETRHA